MKTLPQELAEEILSDIKSFPKLKEEWEKIDINTRKRTVIKWMNQIQRAMDTVGMFA
jgi:hypothetical protein